MTYICFCECHQFGLDKCEDCAQNHLSLNPPPVKIEIKYEGSLAQGIDVRTGPVNDISVDDLQSADDLQKNVGMD